MKKLLVALAVLAVAAAAPAHAADDARVSAGYSFLQYLEEDENGNAPLGAYLSFWSSGGTGVELDLGYHRDTAEGVTLNTFTATAGPRFTVSSDGRVYLHVLGGLRHDRVEGFSNTAWGGLGGLGIDVPAGSIALRLSADFEIFFDEGANAKALRLGVGITF